MVATEIEGVVYELFTSPAMATPPVEVVYQRYWPFVPPETEMVTDPGPHELPLTGVDGEAGTVFIVAITAVRVALSQPLMLRAAK